MKVRLSRPLVRALDARLLADLEARRVVEFEGLGAPEEEEAAEGALSSGPLQGAVRAELQGLRMRPLVSREKAGGLRSLGGGELGASA